MCDCRDADWTSAPHQRRRHGLAEGGCCGVQALGEHRSERVRIEEEELAWHGCGHCVGFGALRVEVADDGAYAVSVDGAGECVFPFVETECDEEEDASVFSIVAGVHIERLWNAGQQVALNGYGLADLRPQLCIVDEGDAVWAGVLRGGLVFLTKTRKVVGLLMHETI